MDDAFLKVEPVFQAAIKRIGDRTFEAETLRRESAAIRMLIATRAIEGQVDNGGWPAVFYNGSDGLVPIAIEGYGLLGLSDHAALASLILDHGFRAEGRRRRCLASVRQSMVRSSPGRGRTCRVHSRAPRRVHRNLTDRARCRSHNHFRRLRTNGVPSGG